MDKSKEFTGVKPKYIIENMRIMELLDGMYNMVESDHDIPYEWNQELQQLMINRRSRFTSLEQSKTV